MRDRLLWVNFRTFSIKICRLQIEGLSSACAVKRRRFSVGESPATAPAGSDRIGHGEVAEAFGVWPLGDRRNGRQQMGRALYHRATSLLYRLLSDKLVTACTTADIARAVAGQPLATGPSRE